MFQRLQKILAAHGFGSRRKAEELITAGRVMVNGSVAELGQKADHTMDRIEVDGKPLQESGAFLYHLLYKPLGVISTNIGADTFAQSKAASQRGSTAKQSVTVRDLLPKELRGRVVSVGRLDKDSEGLLLLTNDGALAHRLMHPRFEHEKEYEVTVDRAITGGALQQLKKGIMIDGILTRRTKVWKLRERTFRIILTEGRNRQIRRMCERIGYGITNLKRVRIGSIVDDHLKPGQVRALRTEEVRSLKGERSAGRAIL